jgi:hypothetical protein
MKEISSWLVLLIPLIIACYYLEAKAQESGRDESPRTVTNLAIGPTGIIVASCSDGTMWQMHTSMDEWKAIKAVPPVTISWRTK